MKKGRRLLSALLVMAMVIASMPAVLVQATESSVTIADIAAKTETFISTYYNQYEQNSNVPITDETYYIEVADYAGDETVLTMGGQEYSASVNKKLSIGKKSYTNVPVWKIKEGKLLVALPWLCMDAVATGKTTITIGSANIEVQVYDPLIQQTMKIDSVKAVGTVAGYTNQAVLQANNTVVNTYGHGTHAVGVVISAEETPVLDPNEVVFRRDNKGGMGLTVPEKFPANTGDDFTYVVYGSGWVNAPIAEAAVKEKPYKLAIPGKGVIDINFEFHEVVDSYFLTDIETKTNAFFDKYYNQYGPSATVSVTTPEDKAVYYVDVAAYTGAETELTMGGVTYTKDQNYKLSIGKNSFIEAPVWTVESGRLLIALPWLCVDAVETGRNPITIGSATLDGQVYEQATQESLSIGDVGVLASQTGYTNEVEVDPNTGVIQYTTGHGTQYVGVKINAGATTILGDQKIFRRDNGTGVMGLIKPVTDYTYWIYPNYQDGPYTQARTTDRDYKLALPGYGTVRLKFHLKEVVNYVVDDISAKTDTFFNTYYNKHNQVPDVPEEDATYYVDIASYTEPVTNETTLTMGGVTYTNQEYSLSIGNNSFIQAPVWKVKEGRLLVALPWLCMDAMETGRNTITIGGATFDGQVYDQATQEALSIGDVGVLASQNGYVNKAEKDPATGVIHYTTGHGTQYVGVEIKSGNTVLLGDQKIFRRDNGTGAMGLIKPVTDYTYWIYPKYQAGPYTQARTTDKDYKLAIPGHGTIGLKFHLKEVVNPTVTFQYDNGTANGTETVVYGTAVTKPDPDPTKAGYTFGGWYTDDACTQAYDFTDPVTEDTTLYAKWNGKTAVTITETPQNATYDGTAKTFEVTSTPASLQGFTIKYKQANNEVQPIAAGTYDVVITRAEDETYAAYNKTITGGLVIAKANVTLTAPTASSVAAGSALSASTLTGGSAVRAGSQAAVAGTFAWTNPGAVVNANGNFEATFTPTDAANYNAATCQVAVTVQAPQEPSVYAFEAAGDTAVKKNVETDGSLRLYASTVKDLGYDHVLVKAAVTAKPNGAADPVVKATDSLGTEWNIIEVGYWGPPAGFPVTKNYNETTNLKLTFPASGTYTIQYQLINKDNSDAVLATGNTTFTVTPVEYTITYNLDGGTNYTGAPTTYTDETATITLGTPTKTGYTFGGWYDNNAFTGNAVTQIAQGSTGDKTLYAKWTAETYGITYELNGGTNYAGAPTSYTIETATVTLGTPTKTGENFAGWYDNAAFTGNAVTEIAQGSTGDKKFYAKWTTKTVITVTDTPQTVTYDGTAKAFALTTTPAELDGFTVKYKQADTEVQPIAAGTYDVEITRAEDGTYAAFSQTITGGLVIEKADVTLTAPAAAAVTEGMPLSTSALTGGSAVREGTEVAVEGTFDWTDGTLVVNETGEFSVTFTPADANNYNTATCNVSVTATPKEESKTVAVGEQSAELESGTAGTTTYTITTTGIADGVAPSILWFTDRQGTQTAAAPSGVSATFTLVMSNRLTLTVTTTANAASGNYYFKMVADGAQSDMAMLVIDIGGDVSVETVPQEGAPNIALDRGTENAVLTQEDKQAVEAGAVVKITMNVEKAETPADADKVEETVTGTQKIGVYLDITLEKTLTPQEGQAVTTPVTETNEPLRLTITIPQELRGNKNYKVVRVHNGVAEVLADLDQNPDTITIESDRYSTYALVYEPALLKVTFMNGTAVYHEIKDIEKGETVTFPSNPSKSGYTFMGWYTKANGNGTKFTVSTPIEENMTVYAYWKANNVSPGPGPRPSGSGNHSTGGGTTGVVVAPPATHEAYISGYGDGTFRPTNETTRAEAAALFAKVSYDFAASQTYSAAYPDLADDWYRNYVGFVSQKGIITGDENGNFRPSESITRAEFAAMAARYLSLAPAGSTSFTDCQGHWADGYINVLVQKGILNGYEDGTFRPDAPITRAEAVKIMNRLLQRTPNIDKLNVSNPFTDVSSDFWGYFEILEATVAHKQTDMH